MTRHDHGLGWVRPVRLSMPSLSDNSADMDRLLRALSGTGTRPAVDYSLFQRVSRLLRQWDFSARCVLFQGGGQLELLDILDPRGESRALGVAVDLGTTRIVMRLVDLESRETLSETVMDNPQISLGSDILTRIHHAATDEGAEELKTLVCRGVDDGLETLCLQAGVSVQEVYIVAISGNTAMTHLFMGLPAEHIIREPYIPVTNTPGTHRASLFLEHTNPEGRVFFFPNIGSYFGGDLISGILFSGIHRQKETSLLVDVGTNAEVVLGNRDWLVGCAGAAGPALEGGVSSMGMTAGDGVIDRVRRDGDDFTVGTIGHLPPLGVCGSGFIDLAAVLFLTGMIDAKGKLVESACKGRYTMEHGLPALIVVPEETSGTGGAITVSQASLDSLIRSKAAMYTILETIVMKVGVGFGDLEKIHVAGTFGAYIDPESAISIGMIPDLDRNRYEKIGNSSLEGATLMLYGDRYMDEADAIRDRITYVELNVDQDFMIRFSGAKFIPHTDPDLFPTVTKK
ncbi:ASKHA domain-containing protein [Desulfoluna butyratoxydans]|nr:ASKHA domain-containing protein [Desulfoluna butyratoxydans]